MTGQELSAFRKRYVYTRKQLADRIGVFESTIFRWETGKRHIPAWVPKFLECIHGKNP